MRKTKELEIRLDSIRDLEQNAVDPTTLHNDATRLIRTLENRLDKALIKFNEARAVGETYDTIIKRLSDERVGFDGQIGTADRKLRQKEKDLDELVMMSHDAAAAKVRQSISLSQILTHCFTEASDSCPYISIYSYQKGRLLPLPILVLTKGRLLPLPLP